jgi:hypothetical protein
LEFCRRACNSLERGANRELSFAPVGRLPVDCEICSLGRKQLFGSLALSAGLLSVCAICCFQTSQRLLWAPIWPPRKVALCGICGFLTSQRPRWTQSWPPRKVAIRGIWWLQAFQRPLWLSSSSTQKLKSVGTGGFKRRNGLIGSQARRLKKWPSAGSTPSRASASSGGPRLGG